MKVRRGLEHDDTVELNMTSMIDIVFQLLVFFIMTFKIVAQEGDFNVRMPTAASGGPPSEEFNEPLKITLNAFTEQNSSDPHFFGRLSDIEVTEGLDDKDPPPPFTTWKQRGALRAYVEQVYFENRERESAEAILVLAPTLKYLEIIDVMTQISGKIDDSGRLIKLYEKISFEAPKE